MEQQSVAFRLPTQLLDRVDRLQRAVESDPRLVAFALRGRSTTLRLALEQGVAALEREYQLEMVEPHPLAEEPQPAGSASAYPRASGIEERA